MAGDRVHRLAQAVQVADLLAERIDQLAEVVQWMNSTPPAERDPRWEERLGLALGNVRRARHAYRTVRDPEVRT